MRVAIPICRGRVTPVFDVAEQLIVYDVESKSVLQSREYSIRGDHTRALVELGIDVLICAAISRELACFFQGLGIKVIAGVCGISEQVIDGFVNNRLGDREFAMPGRCRHGKQQRGGCARRRQFSINDQNRQD